MTFIYVCKVSHDFKCLPNDYSNHRLNTNRNDHLKSRPGPSLAAIAMRAFVGPIDHIVAALGEDCIVASRGRCSLPARGMDWPANSSERPKAAIDDWFSAKEWWPTRLARYGVGTINIATWSDQSWMVEYCVSVCVHLVVGIDTILQCASF